MPLQVTWPPRPASELGDARPAARSGVSLAPRLSVAAQPRVSSMLSLPHTPSLPPQLLPHRSRSNHVRLSPHPNRLSAWRIRHVRLPGRHGKATALTLTVSASAGRQPAAFPHVQPAVGRCQPRAPQLLVLSCSCLQSPARQDHCPARLGAWSDKHKCSATPALTNSRGMWVAEPVGRGRWRLCLPTHKVRTC